MAMTFQATPFTISEMLPAHLIDLSRFVYILHQTYHSMYIINADGVGEPLFIN